MKLTKSKLKQIIKEELNKYLHEGAESMPKYGTMPCRALKEHAKHYPEAKKEFERRLKTDCAHLAPKKESIDTSTMDVPGAVPIPMPNIPSAPKRKTKKTKSKGNEAGSKGARVSSRYKGR